MTKNPPAESSAVFTSCRYDRAMTNRKNFKAIPIQMEKRYQRKAALRPHKVTVQFLSAGVLAGGILGIGSVLITPGGSNAIGDAVRPIAVTAGFVRARLPQEGDHWSRCDEARAAGSTPLYFGEPGYRDGLDRDGDGVACEPYRGMR
jgi:hypothetical protein